MANEATLVIETSIPIAMTCADGTGIEKGTCLKMTDPFTVSAQSAANDIVGGIAGSEKIASDGITKIDVYRGGVFKMTASGAITVGDAVVFDVSANHVKTAPIYPTLSGANIVGTALETAATGETLLVELNPQTVRYA